MSKSLVRLAIPCLLGVMLFCAPVAAEAMDAASVPVVITVRPYADVVTQSGFHFGTLSGERGIYHLAPNSLRELFIMLLELNWGLDWLQHWQDDDEPASLAHLNVVSNVPVEVEFEFVPGTDWISAPTLFGVWSDDQYKAQYFGSGTPPIAPRVVVIKPAGPTWLSLGGAILIEEVDAVEAGDYSAVILVTVSAEK